MLREPLGKYKVAVWEFDTDYIEGKRKRKIPMMFYYPSDAGSQMCPYKDVLFQNEISEGKETDNVLCADLASNGFIVVSIGHPYGSGAVTYTDGTMFEVPENFDENEKKLENLGLLWEKVLIQ